MHRNLFDSKDVSAATLNACVHYVRQQIHFLDTQDSALILSGIVHWGDFIKPKKLE